MISHVPIVENHTFEHEWLRNIIMHFFIGITLIQCSIFGIMYSLVFDIQAWYWDCVDNTRINLTLV